jgi:DNA-binding NarL/FixJ family response regulator
MPQRSIERPEKDEPTIRRARLNHLQALLRRSPQKQRIAALVYRGLTNRQIAERLGCSAHNVHSLLHQLYAAVGPRGRVELGVMVSDLVRARSDELSLGPNG